MLQFFLNFYTDIVKLNVALCNGDNNNNMEKWITLLHYLDLFSSNLKMALIFVSLWNNKITFLCSSAVKKQLRCMHIYYTQTF